MNTVYEQLLYTTLRIECKNSEGKSNINRNRILVVSPCRRKPI